jgi:hypothetical protein
MCRKCRTVQSCDVKGNGKAVRIMKPISSIHAGEYLVGTHIEENYKTFNVWLPSKDTGIDLLVTDKTNSKTVSLQVKFSKDFLGSLGNSLSEVVATKVKSGGWWTFNPEKIRSSRADLWVLVLYRFSRRDYDLLVIEPAELLRKYKQLNRTGTIQSYVWVTASGKCWETRGLNKQKQIELANDDLVDSARDLSAYLNNWRVLETKLA